MTIYKCECGEEQKDILKATIVLREGRWVANEALCSCNKYMNSEPVEGMPNLRRTEASLSKNRDKLWEGAKEKLTGERGVNEPFK